ncbi:MAG: RNA chaperone Hfq [Nitrospirota bacterium]|nr:RNA chaperone Hfq [Nitrospirota bacterium]
MSEKNLIEVRLQQALTSKSPLSLLINGKQRITGLVTAFDAHTVLMDCGRNSQMVYRHVITDVTDAAAAGQMERPASRGTQVPSRSNDKGRNDRKETSPRKQRPAPASPSSTQKQEPEQQTPPNPMSGALGEELRKWLQRTTK